MEEIEQIIQNLHITEYDVKTQHWVNVTHINNPHDFYVRPTQYIMFVHKIETLQFLTKPPFLDEYDIVIFDMNRSGNTVQHARGRIILKQVDRSTVKYDIFAVDYGSLHKEVIEEYIWECNEDLVKVPPLALHCRLQHCAALGGMGWTEEAIDTFKYFTEKESIIMTIMEKTCDMFIVELRNMTDDIATLLAYSGCATLGYVHNAVNRHCTVTPKKMFYTFKNVKVNETLHVRVQSGRSHKGFYVAEVNDYQAFLKECDNITYCAKKTRDLTEDEFKIKTPVCVRDDLNKFNRAIIIKIIVPDTKAIVKYVDTGKEEEAHILRMKPVPAQYLKMPVVAIFCTTEESQVMNFGFYKFFHPGFEYLIQIKQLGNEFQSPNIVNVFPLPGSSSKSYKK